MERGRDAHGGVGRCTECQAPRKVSLNRAGQSRRRGGERASSDCSRLAERPQVDGLIQAQLCWLQAVCNLEQGCRHCIIWPQRVHPIEVDVRLGGQDHRPLSGAVCREGDVVAFLGQGIGSMDEGSELDPVLQIAYELRCSVQCAISVQKLHEYTMYTVYVCLVPPVVASAS